jgi:hypothetical protein
MRVSENMVLRRFESKRDDMRAFLRKLHNEALNNLYSSANIITAIKPKGMSSVVHEA